jgi:hypothetical protein
MIYFFCPNYKISVFAWALMLSSIFGVSCNTANFDTALNTLNALVQNKTLAEQFVRDVKSSIQPADYEQIMQAYDEARAAYNRVLDLAELAARGKDISKLDQAAEEARDSAADFFATATRSLRPTMDTRQIPFKRGITIPDNLSKNLRCLPKSDRTHYIDQFDNQVRWRSWNQL